jgi:hypothetical protein
LSHSAAVVVSTSKLLVQPQISYSNTFIFYFCTLYNKNANSVASWTTLIQFWYQFGKHKILILLEVVQQMTSYGCAKEPQVHGYRILKLSSNLEKKWFVS